MFDVVNPGDAMLLAATAIATLMSATWVVSLVLKNASIVDLVWGAGFVVVGWSVFLASDAHSAVGKVLLVGVSLWGVRLAGYLTWRNHGKGEDYRYVAMRRRWGSRFPIVSLFTVFVLQGTIMWIVSLPLQIGISDTNASLGALAYIGVVVWLLGITFEAVGDAQLARFKADPANEGKVMNRGLWKYSRHPNYFGDACVWWGLALVACSAQDGVWSLIGAAVMTLFLRRISGVTLLEKSLVKRREGYDDYIRTTSPFVPRPPKR